MFESSSQFAGFQRAAFWAGLLLATVACRSTPPAEPDADKPASYDVSRVASPDPDRLLIDTGQHFQIALETPGTPTLVRLPLEGSPDIQLDRSQLALLQHDGRSGVSNDLVPARVAGPVLTATLSESGIYSVVGFPLDLAVRRGAWNYCAWLANSGGQNEPPLPQICLVIDCPAGNLSQGAQGQADEGPICAMCARMLSARYFPECRLLPEEPTALPEPVAWSNASATALELSEDGRYVAFFSEASNLVPNDHNGSPDVFLRDRTLARTERLNVGPAGAEWTGGWPFSASLSADGRLFAFWTESPGTAPMGVTPCQPWPDDCLYLRDRIADTTELLMHGDDRTAWEYFRPALSAGGRWVGFAGRSGRGAPSQSGVFLYDRTAGGLSLVIAVDDPRLEPPPAGFPGLLHPSLDAAGERIAFTIERNGPLVSSLRPSDVFVVDRDSGGLQLVSVSMSGDPGNGPSFAPRISADGGAVVFLSYASDLVAGDANRTWDVFVRNLVTGETRRVSVASDGTEQAISPEHTYLRPYLWDAPSISGAGHRVAFWSPSDDLVAGDSNGVSDVFLHDLTTGNTRRVSVSSNGTPSNGWSFNPAISENGQVVGFRSYATNLVAQPTYGFGNVYVHEVASGTTELVSVPCARRDCR